MVVCKKCQKEFSNIFIYSAHNSNCHVESFPNYRAESILYQDEYTTINDEPEGDNFDVDVDNWSSPLDFAVPVELESDLMISSEHLTKLKWSIPINKAREKLYSLELPPSGGNIMMNERVVQAREQNPNLITKWVLSLSAHSLITLFSTDTSLQSLEEVFPDLVKELKNAEIPAFPYPSPQLNFAAQYFEE